MENWTLDSGHLGQEKDRSVTASVSTNCDAATASASRTERIVNEDVEEGRKEPSQERNGRLEGPKFGLGEL